MSKLCASGRVAGAVLLAGLLAGNGCASTSQGTAGSPPEKRNPVMTSPMYPAVAELAALDLDQIQPLQALLGTTLQAQDSGQGWQQRQAAGGQLGEVALARVELRSPPAGQAGSPVLLLQLAQPQPFDPLQWPGAQPSPPRPDAPDAPAWWELRLQRSSVVLGLDDSQQAIVSISVRQQR